MSTPTLLRPSAVAIRDRRAALGISQQRLAELAGCSLSMVRLLDRGYAPEASAVLDRINSILNDVEPAANGLDGKVRDDGAQLPGP